MSKKNDAQKLATEVDGKGARATDARANGKRERRPKSYLLLPDYRRISLKTFEALTEEKALASLQRIRWEHLGPDLQQCPKCGSVDAHYVCPSIRGFKCKACKRQFTVFSGTRLHSTKMSAKELLSIALHFVEAKDSMSSRELSSLHGRNHQTLHVLTLKIREALRESLEAEGMLQGSVQADAAYFIKYVRPPNSGNGPALGAKADQKNAGLDENGKAKKTVSPNMCALVVFVQEPTGSSGRRCRIAMIKTEHQVAVLREAQRFCAPDAVLTTDQHHAYLTFSGEFDEHFQVNHSECFRDENGRHTNYAEGVFSRIRAAVHGAWHRMSLQYLAEYGWEVCWRLEMIGKDNRTQLEDLLTRLLRSGRPTRFVDYWRKRPGPPASPPEEIGVVREVPKDSVPKARGRPPKGLAKAKAPDRKVPAARLDDDVIDSELEELAEA